MRATQIVETVTGGSLAELRAARDRVTGADMVELRLDGVSDIDVAGALEGRTKPVVVTCRPVREGGRFDGSEEDRLRILGDAIRLGAEFVDVEWGVDTLCVPCGQRTRLVVSHHDFAGVPADLEDRVRSMRATGAAVVKVAVAARRVRDCLTLKRAMGRDEGEHIAIAMGSAGQLTRIWPAWFGSCWTYAGAAAPGQLATRDLLELYRVTRTTAGTAVYGLAGAPLGHSASPAIHNTAFAHVDLDALYVPIETADPAEFFEVADAIGLAGASVTAPLKASLFEQSTAVDELPARLGAINTLRRGKRGWESRNFDVAGFLGPLDRRPHTWRRSRAVVIGAGGAARAVVWALKTHGARVEISARRPEQARALARRFRVSALTGPPAPGWDILVNATPVGTWPHVDASPIAREGVAGAENAIVYDLVYNPAETQLMRWAREAGADVIGGIEMLVDQARAQVEWWTGHRPPREVLDAAARAFVEAGPSRPRCEER